MYVIAGVSGNTGRVVADTLLAKGEKVRVIVRDAAKASDFAARGAEVAIADLNDEAAMTKALQGAKGAYLLIPPNTGATHFRAYQQEMAQALCAAVRQSAVPHVVFLSSIGADKESGTGPIAGLYDAERLFSAIPTTKTQFIRAAYFMENIGGSLAALAHGVYPSFSPAAFGIPMIASQDIGALAAELLSKGADRTEIINLGGNATSPSDVAQVLSDLTGKPVSVAETPVAAMAQTLAGYGVPAPIAALYQEMTEGMLSDHIAFEPQHRHVMGQTQLGEVLKPMLQR